MGPGALWPAGPPGGPAGCRQHLAFQPAARDAIGARQVHHLAQRAQVVEAAAPVVAHHERRAAVLADVLFLLRPAGLGDRQVDVPAGANDLDAVGKGHDRALALDRVGLVGGHRDGTAVVGNSRADRVRQRDPAGAVGRQQARHAELGVRPKGERIEKVVIDAAVDDVDAFRTLRCAHEDLVILDEHVLAFDEFDTHLLGEEGVFEVGAVIGAGCQYDDRRIIDPERRDAA